MNERRTSQFLILLAALFGLLAFGCQCASQRRDYPNGPTLEQWMAEEPTEFPKLSEP